MQKNEIYSEVITLIKNGDEKAFGIVFRSFYGILVNFSNEYLADREASRSIVQTVFMKLWEKRDFLKESDSLKAYLYTITRNECISYLRHLKVSHRFAEKSTATAEDLQLNLDAINDLDFSNIDLENIERIIQETIENLPDRCREVFILSRYDQLKNQEIADKLQISVKAVEANITRALKIFRENLKDYMPAALLHILFNGGRPF